MVRTEEGLFSEMRAVGAIADAISDLERNAPESRMLKELHEAMRVAHPAVFDRENNGPMHARFRKSHPDVRLPGSAAVEPTRVDAGVQLQNAAANLSADQTAQLLTLLAAVPADVMKRAQERAFVDAQQNAPQNAPQPPAPLPGDENTTRVGP